MLAKELHNGDCDEGPKVEPTSLFEFQGAGWSVFSGRRTRRKNAAESARDDQGFEMVVCKCLREGRSCILSNVCIVLRKKGLGKREVEGDWCFDTRSTINPPEVRDTLPFFCAEKTVFRV